MIFKPEFKDGLFNEYPRPQFKRDSYLCLNGFWDYVIKENEDIIDNLRQKKNRKTINDFKKGN